VAGKIVQSNACTDAITTPGKGRVEQLAKKHRELRGRNRKRLWLRGATTGYCLLPTAYCGIPAGETPWWLISPRNSLPR
jgi:hypothetical protein